MLNIIKAETYKLIHNKLVIITFIICLAFSALIYYFGSTLEADSLSSAVATTFSNLQLLFIIIVGTLVTSEYESGTMKNLILSGVSRTNIYLGRLVACIFVCGALLMVGILVSGLTAFFIHGLNGTLVSLLQSVLLQFVLMVGIVSLTYLIASLVKRTAIALIIAFLIIDFLQMPFTLLDKKFNLHLEGYDFNSLMNSIVNSTSTGSAIAHLAITVSFVFLITITIGNAFFKRSEV